TPVEDAPAEETPVEDAPAEETPVEEVPAEETPVEEAPAEETPVEEAPAEETPVEEAPAEETPVEETPVEETPVEDAPAEETPVEDAPVEDAPAEDAPAEDAPAEDAPAEETAIVAAPVVSISKTEEEPEEEPAPKADHKKLYGYTDVIIPRAPHDSLEFKTLTLGVSFDATAIMNLRASIKENGSHMGTENITINDMILFATAKVLRKFKALNAHFLEDRIRYFDNVHLGIAVDTPEGLKKPTVFDANKLSLSALSKVTKLIIKDAREGTDEKEKWEGASFTVSNLGSHGIESFTPVLMAPQTGVLGVCASAKRIKEENGEAVFYPAIPLSLTFDTRALDTTSAAKFLRELVFALENFELLLLK
ncbi:MAG: 2-oxo acid dehydrogenase subunit E2, partial [Clostridia bacterium]|nr:2-oxo acid dehydrogenase subunit E2 [Clostridia bacterium]